MKKTALLSFMLCLLIGLSGCASSPPYTLQGPPQITQTGGLGDTVSVFAKNYGVNSGNEEIGRFQDGFVNPLFIEEKAYEMMIDFKQSSQSEWTKKQVMDKVMKMIPADAVKQKEYVLENNSSREIIEYKSPSLQRVFSDKPEIFKPANPGVFTVVLEKNENGYYSAVIGTGIYYQEN